MKNLLKNKVISYISSRYLIYGIQFVSLMMVAEKLGPYNYGIWSFILLLLSYMMAINLGIGNSINVYLIQYKNNPEKVKDYAASAFAANGLVIVLLLGLSSIYIIRPDLFGKYDIGVLFYVAILIGILQYINQIYTNIYRARNYLFEVAFNQSVIPILILISVIFATGTTLIYWLVGSYLLGNISSLALYFIRKGSPRGGKVRLQLIKNLFHKGFYLFVYNSAFTLILTTTSSFVSKYYSIDEYGLYSFSYTLGHSILLLMTAFSYIIFPKIIDKLYNASQDNARSTIKILRSNYVNLSYLLMYAALTIFPLFIKLFPKFENSIIMLNMMTLAIILTTNSFGFNTYLIANNKEKLSALISIISLILNIVISYLVTGLIKMPYYLSVISMMMSYICFSLLCSWCAHKAIFKNTKGFFLSVFPIKSIIPYAFAFTLTLFNLNYLMSLVLLLFLILNRESVNEIIQTIKQLIKKPQIIDITTNE